MNVMLRPPRMNRCWVFDVAKKVKKKKKKYALCVFLKGKQWIER